MVTVREIVVEVVRASAANLVEIMVVPVLVLKLVDMTAPVVAKKAVKLHAQELVPEDVEAVVEAIVLVVVILLVIKAVLVLVKIIVVTGNLIICKKNLETNRAKRFPNHNLYCNQRLSVGLQVLLPCW